MKRWYFVMAGLVAFLVGFLAYDVYQMRVRDDYHLSTNQLYERAPGAASIPPLNDPTITTVADADNTFRDTSWGVDVESAGQHRFYPLDLLAWHEVINDTFDGERLAVTYSPLSGSVAAYARGEGESYAASPYVYNSTTVLKTSINDHLIDQLRGVVIAADGSATSAQPLVRKAFVLMTWGAWKAAYPQGSVASFETGFDRDYSRAPYGATYATDDEILFPVNHVETRLGLKDIVYGVETDNGQIVFAEKNLVEGQPVKVATKIDGVAKDVTALLKDGVVHIDAVYIRAMAFAYFADYPGAVLAN